MLMLHHTNFLCTTLIIVKVNALCVTVSYFFSLICIYMHAEHFEHNLGRIEIDIVQGSGHASLVWKHFERNVFFFSFLFQTLAFQYSARLTRTYVPPSPSANIMDHAYIPVIWYQFNSFFYLLSESNSLSLWTL